MQAVADYQGYKLIGKAWDVERKQPVRHLVMVDKNGVVVGLGRLQRAPGFFWPLGWQGRDQDRWVAYTREMKQAAAVTVWGLLEDGKYCSIAELNLSSAELPMMKK
jgi:hypothetical protein